MFQKHILDELRATPQLRYTQMQPDGVESSHFKYHLDQLVRDGLVERVDRGLYALSDKGKSAVDRLSVGRINPHQTPKVITYTLLRDDTHYYLYRKDKEPFLATLNMVAGKVHLDERTQDASVREVMEKTGQAIENPELKTIAEVRIHQNGQLVSHFVAYVFVAAFHVGNPLLEKIDPADLDKHADLAPDLLPLVRAIENGEQYVDVNL